jgi:hypothetical protein
MKGYLAAALIGAGLLAVTANVTAAGAATAEHASLFQAPRADDISLFGPHAALTELTASTSPFSDLQVDPTALPPLGASLLTPDGATRHADFMLSPTLDFGAVATQDQVSLAPLYGQADPLAGDAWRNRSLLAGLSWNFAQWGGVDLTMQHDNFFVMSSDNPAISSVSRVNIDTLGVSGRLGLGEGWVTTASYSAGLSQLDLRSGATPEPHAQSYSFSIAKHGLFGDDALGFSFSQPATGPANHDLASLVALDNLPPVYAGGAHLSNYTPETDFQVGYVTSYLNGALALQTNAAYQMNVQGQSGTNAVTLLSRAKIKF